MSGPMTTVATNLSNVTSMAVASDGTLYAISTDHVIKIAGGVATNVTAPGSFGTGYWQASTAAAADGSLFVSDPTNDVIDRVSTSGSITPFAGSCKAGAGFSGTAGQCWRVPFGGTGSSANFGEPGSLAYDSASNTLYVADNQSQQLWSVSSSGVVTPVAGYGAPENVDGNGVSAFLNYPTSIAFAPASGSVDILEAAPNNQQEIVAFSTVGTIHSSVYTPPARPVYFPNGLWSNELGASPDGGAWSVDGTQKNIVRVSAVGGVTTYPLIANVTPSWHVAVDAAGNAWFTAQSLDSSHIMNGSGLLEVAPSGTQTYIAAPGSSSSSQVDWVTIGPDGNPWFTQSASFGAASYDVVDSSTHAVTQYAIPVAGNSISQAPGGLAFETSVAGQAGIQFASTSGQLGNGYNVQGVYAQSLHYRASDSTVWFTDGNATISSMTASGAEQDYHVCSNCDPLDLTVAPDGSIWSDEGNSSGGIVRVTPSGQVQQYLLPITLGVTYGMSARPDGKLWVYDTAGVLYIFDPAAYDAMNGPHPAQMLRRPSGVGARVPWHRKF